MVEEIEELEQNLCFDAFPNIKPLGKAHIQIYVRRCCECVAASCDINTVHSPITIGVDCGVVPTKMKSTLCSKDSA